MTTLTVTVGLAGNAIHLVCQFPVLVGSRKLAELVQMVFELGSVDLWRNQLLGQLPNSWERTVR